MKLTSREQQQIKAALAFWNDLAEISLTHPSRFGGIEGYFKHKAPLSYKQIEVLIERFGDREPSKPNLLTIKMIAEEVGQKLAWVNMRRRRYSIQAVPQQKGLYRRSDLKQIYTDAKNVNQSAPR